MLVLTRKLEEEIRIGEQIVVRVLSVKDGQVKLGVEAPRSIRVLRGEVYQAIQEQNKAAAMAGMTEAAQAAARLVGLNRPNPDTPHEKH
jgi:carbon storage regulator